jgi:molybdopterin molybdotransferase
VKVRRKPRVALIANGDELVLPGERPGPDQIVCSIDVGLAAMIREWGGDATFLGVARDDKASIRALADQAFDADLIVPIGGASVGDKDYMRTVFAELGFRPVFDKVSVKPGKPTWFSVSGSWAVLGVPGNPASALVTAALFLQAALTRFLGARDEVGYATARTTVALPPAGARETFLRARFSDTGDGVRYVTPFDDQDSSLLSVMARANALIRRPAGAGPAAVGDTVLCLPLLRGSRVA